MASFSKSILSGIILLYYFISSLTALLRPAKDTVKFSRRTQHFHLAITAIIILLSVSISIERLLKINGTNHFKAKEPDDDLFAELLFSLQWLVLLLAHVDYPGAARYPQYGTWCLSMCTKIYTLVDHQNCHANFSLIDMAISISTLLQVVLILVLATTTAVLHRFARKALKQVADGEAQPLLASADSSKYGKAQEESHSSESEEQKKAREELHNRPIREYLKSFGIYLPILWPSNIQQKIYFGCMCLCTLAVRGINILDPLAFGWIIDTLAKGEAPWLLVGAYFTLYFLQSRTGIGLVSAYLHLLIANYQRLALSRAAYDHVMDLSADFQDSKTSSEIWQAMNQAQSVINLFYDAAFEVAPMLIDFGTGFILLWVIFGSYMGFLVATLMVLMVWTCINAVKSRVDLTRKWRDTYYDQYHQMVDSTENWYTAAQFGQIPREKRSFETKQSLYIEDRNKLYYWGYRATATRFSLLTFAYLLAAALAAYEIYHGELKVGAFAVLTGYWAQVAHPIMYVVHEISDVTDKLVDAEKLLVLLEKKATIKDSPNAVPFQYLGGAVEFENVFFTYEGKKKAAEGVTFRSTPGKVTALVGETGGGKSTILKLLMRFYDPEKGRVLIDGQDVRDLQMDTFRKHIAVVPQEPSMFHSTILDNVRYPCPDITEE